MTAPDRIAVYWTAVDEGTTPARLMAQTPRSPIFDEDLPKSQRIEYVRADLATPQSWDDVTGTKHVQFPRTTPLAEAQIAAAVNAVWSEMEDSKTQRWTLRKEHIHNAIATALRAIGEGKA